MLKKKNIAMVMAATTVATSVAPVFAASLDGETISVKDAEKVAQLKEEIKGYLDTKLTDVCSSDTNAVDDSVYNVVLTEKDGITPVTIETIKQLQTELDKLVKAGESIEINVTNDIPYAKLGDDIIDWTVKNYKSSELADVINDANNLKDDSAGLVEDVEKVDANTVSITLKNNETPLVVKTGDVKLDFTTATYKKDSYGNFLDKDGKIIDLTDADAEDNKVVVGFEYDKDTLLDAADAEDKKTITVEYKNITTTTEFSGSELYNSTTKRLTQQGDELTKLVRNYTLLKDSSDSDVVITKADNNLSITLQFPNTVGDIAKSTKKITGTSVQIEAIYDKLEAARDDKSLDTLGGEGRAETAVEVSKEAFADGATTVVLVSGSSIADGLAATPFAASMDAPILLTGTNSVSTSTIDEIERLGAETVYIVGGTSSINESVVDQLENKELEVKRISGADRYATSLKIAKEMLDDTDADTVYVAGGYAEADTMSIAAVAATDGHEQPILLVGSNGLSEDQSDWLNDMTNDTDAYVVGGENSVSKATITQLNSVVSGTVDRIAGATRQETNAKVIEEFYGDAEGIDTVYVAKSDNNGLVDALSAGVAASIAGAPVVLATSELDASQNSILNKLDYADAVAKKQIGYGIADKVWVAINKLF